MENVKLKSLLKLIIPPVAAFFLAGVSDADSFEEKASTIVGIVSLVALISQPLKAKFNLEDWPARVLVWGVSLAVSFLSWFTGWVFEGIEWYYVAVWGVGIGVAANGYYTIDQVKSLLALLGIPRKKQ